MPRVSRVQFEGAFYHIYDRGNRRERIFLDDADYARFERMLFDTADRSGVRLYRWSFMPNHFHLLVETPEGNIAEFMGRLLTRYAQYFNWRHGLVGHVFQGRYSANICDKDAYFMELIRYIELNPYRTKSRALASLGTWKWSSHRYAMLPKSQWPVIIRPWFQEVFDRFGDNLEMSRKRYAQFLSEGLKKGQWEDFYKTKGGRFLGSEAFLEKVKRRAEEPVRQQVRAYRKLTRVDQLVHAVATLSGCTLQLLTSCNRQKTLSQWRQALVRVGRHIYRFSVKDLAVAIGRDPSAASQILRRSRRNSESSEMRRLRQALAL